MSKGRIPYGSWMFRVLTWDAALPALIAIVPAGLGLLFPNRRGVIEITAVSLPIVAFFLRIRAGRRHIDSNACSNTMQTVQLCVFCVAIFPLVLLECFLILSSLLPNDPFSNLLEALFMIGVFSIFYLPCMTFAMYPGRTLPASIDLDRFGFPADEWASGSDWSAGVDANGRGGFWS